jgi:DNA-binding NarL/FixJ family response regulator
MALVSPQDTASTQHPVITLVLGAASPDALLPRAVEALIRELLPAATVAYADAAFPAPEGVTIQVEDTARWLLVTPRLVAREIAQAFGAGAWTVVAFDSAQGDLRRAIESLVRGDTPYVPRDVSQRIARRRTKGDDEIVALTAREAGVLELLARGYSNAEIAAQLTISENTVRTHLHTLSSKLHAQSRLKIVARARDEGLIETVD